MDASTCRAPQTRRSAPLAHPRACGAPRAAAGVGREHRVAKRPRRPRPRPQATMSCCDHEHVTTEDPSVPVLTFQRVLLKKNITSRGTSRISNAPVRDARHPASNRIAHGAHTVACLHPANTTQGRASMQTQHSPPVCTGFCMSTSLTVRHTGHFRGNTGEQAAQSISPASSSRTPPGARRPHDPQ